MPRSTPRSPATLCILAVVTCWFLVPQVKAAQFAAVTCNGSGNLMVAFENGDAFVGTHTPCPYCPPTDTLTWAPAPSGNILASAGRAGDRMVGLIGSRGLCGYLVCVTAQGYILMGSDSYSWSPSLEGQTVFQRLGTPPEPIVGTGSDGDAVYLLTQSGSVLRVQYVGGGSFTVARVGGFPWLMPTPTVPASWGQLKARYR